MGKRLNGVAGVGAVTATVTLLALQPVHIGRDAPALLLLVVGGWLFVRGAFLAASALFTAAEADDHKWRLWLIPLQVILGFGALYAAIWRLDPGSLVGAGLEPSLSEFSAFAATLGAAGSISPESWMAGLAMAAEVVVVAIVAGALVRRLHRGTGWVVGVMALVFAGGLALALGQERRLPDDFQRGVSFTGYTAYDYATDDAYENLRDAADHGAERVTVTSAWYQATPRSSSMGPDKWRTTAPESIREVIQKARGLGLNVTVKPHLNSLDGTYRGEIAPRHADRWFRSYSRMMRRYARLAERTGADQFVVGTELEGVSGHERRWRRLIADIRRRFSGKLTYAANYDEVFRIKFWDALDFIGVDAYFPLAERGEPGVAELVEAWEDPLRKLERLHKRWNKKLLLTEIGYPSAESALRTPYEAKGAQDLDLQKDAVEAAFTAIAERPWVVGAAWWEWWSRASKLEKDDNEFAVNGKPAAGVIREWYSE